ncbi:MAG: hypothetical protein LUG58_03745, partial [Clostridiales bacterium]|nr:hypothetical protein [Clostridiales bacterium]
MSLIVTPVYAADSDGTSSGAEASEACSTLAATFSEPEAADAEVEAAVEDVEEELVVEEDYGISLAAEEEYTAENGTAFVTSDGTTTYYGSLADAVSAAISGSTIILLKDVSLSSSIAISSGTVTLDLNGKSITRASDNTTSYLVGVASDAIFTVKDSSSDANGYIDGATYTVTTTDDDGNETTSTKVGYAILTNGSLTLESGTLKGYRGVTVSGDNASLTVNGGTVSGTYSATNSYGIYQTGGTVNITSGTVSGYRAIYGTAGTLNVSGGTVSGSQVSIMANYSLNVNVSNSATVIGTNGIYAYQDYYTGTVTVSGGTVGNENTSFAVNVRCGTAYITGGTLTATDVAVNAIYSGTTVYIGTPGSNSGPSLSADYAVQIYSEATVNIYSGTITATTCGVYVKKGTLTVEGGKISSNGLGISTNGTNNTDYYPNTITINGGEISGAYGMYLPAVNSITTVTGGTITGSVTGIEIRAGLLTVTGGTIKSTYTDTFATENNGSGTTVVGAGVAVSQHTTDNAITVIISGGEISGIYGVYEINYNTTNNSTVSVNATEATDGSSATITTTDSSQGAAVYSTSLDESSTSTAKNSNTSVALSAGTYNTDVSAYTTDTSAAVATTTTTDEDGNNSTVYEVVETVIDAVAVVYDVNGIYLGSTASLSYISKLENECTVKLIADVSEKTFTLKDNYTVTLDLCGYDIICTNSSSYPYSPIYVTNGSLTVIDSTVADGEVGDSVLSTTKGNGVVFVTGGDVTIDAGNYISYSSSGQTVQISSAATSSSVTINNGTFTSV